MLKNLKGAFLALCGFAVFFLVVFLLLGDSKKTQGTTNNAAFNQSVLNAIAELNLPTSNNANAIGSAADSLTSFISYRSGITINQTNKDLLETKEQLSWNQSKKLSKEQLADILTEIASDKLRNLTDAQRDSAVDDLRGFNHTNLPQSFQDGREFVSLRANGKGHMTAVELTNQLNAIRGSNVDSKLTQTLINVSILAEIDDVIDTLIGADPNFFGGNTKGDMTPIQAVLVSYAVVTDDLLMGNQTEMNQMLLDAHTALNNASNGGYPSPTGYKPYGTNGYKWSSPSNFLMDDASTTALINKIAQRSNL